MVQPNSDDQANLRPTRKSGVRLCLQLSPDGLTVYANQQALVSISEQLLWLARSDARDHYECHVKMSLEEDDCRFEGKRPRNVWTLMPADLIDHFTQASDLDPGFELTFMVVSEHELDDMAHHQETGVLRTED